MEQDISVLSLNTKNKIMKKIYAIWFLRKITSPFAVKAIFLIIVLFEVATYYSLSSIFGNLALASGNISGLSGYMTSIFQDTALVSKLVFVGALFIVALFAQETFNLCKNSILSFHKKENFQKISN